MNIIWRLIRKVREKIFRVVDNGHNNKIDIKSRLGKKFHIIINGNNNTVIIMANGFQLRPFSLIEH